MKKRLLSFLVLTAMLLLQIQTVTVYSSENILEMNTLFSCDFDSGVTPVVGDFVSGGATTVSEGGRTFLRADSRNGAVKIYAYPEKWQKCDSALVSFDFRTDSTTCRSYMDVFNATADGSRPSTDSAKMNRAWYITQRRCISFFESFIPPCGTADDSTFAYEADTWYHLDMWIDYRTNTITYYVEGGDIGTKKFDETFTGVGGFRITVDSTNGGSSYDFDNMMVVSFPERGGKIPLEGIAIPDNFENPITIDYRQSENRLGFIFPSKDIDLTAYFKNQTMNTAEVVVETVITDENYAVVKEFSDEFIIKTDEEKKLDYDLRVEKYGFYNISTRVKEKQDGDVLSENEFQFSVMNAPPEGLKNPKVSVCDHSADGHGYEEMERKYELISLAGFNGIRMGMDYASCPNRVNGDYTIDESSMKQNVYAAKYNLEQIMNLTAGKNPPKTEEEFQQWEKFVEQIVLQHLKTKNPGTVTHYCVWNEYNGEGFNYNGATEEHYAELLRRTYPIIKRLDENSEVRGFVASPTYVPQNPQDATDWIKNVLEYGGGDYMDAADIHPYNHTAPENTDSFRGRFIDATRDLLDEYGYEDMPITFSEMGWSTPGTVSEAEQGAFFVRWMALNYTKFKDVALYVSQVKQTTSNHENGFGLIRSWNKKGADGYKPYSAKPAFLAVANYNTIMSGAEFVSDSYSWFSGVYNYKFKDRHGNDIQLVWRKDGNSDATVKTSTQNIAVLDLYGNDYPYEVTSNGIRLKVSNKPVYIKEITQPVSLEAFVNYNTGVVTVSGNVNSAEERVGITVADQLNPQSFAFIGQTTANSGGDFSVKFDCSQYYGNFNVKIGFDDGVKTTEIEMPLRIPQVIVTSGNAEITKLSQLSAGDTLTARLEEIGQCSKDEDAHIIIAQYADKRLVAVEMTEVYAGSRAAEFSATVKDKVDSIKVMYWSKNTQTPLLGEYEIN